MIRNILVLPDGTELAAGTPGTSALRSLRWNCAVNAGTDLNPGSACADSIEAELWVEPGTAPGIAAGDRVELWRQPQGGERVKAGVFVAQQPVRSRRNLYRLTAYDPLSLTEKEISPWLRDHQGDFPLTLTALARAVAGVCGVTLANDPPRNGDYAVRPFYADGLTGRQLLQWAAQAAGCYLHCDADGALVFGWYTDRRGQYALCPGAEADPAPGTPLPYRQDGLTYADYETAPIHKVQIRQSGSDVGVLYPPDATGTNALVIEGNLLLTAPDADTLRPVAQALYEAAQSWPAYTPCTVSAFAECEARPGDLLYAVTPQGRLLTTCVMSAVYEAGQTRLESTGNPRRDSVAAVNAARLNLSGKLLEMQADIGQLSIRASDLSGDFSELKQSVDSLSLTVSQASEENLFDGAVWYADSRSPAGSYTLNGTSAAVRASTDRAGVVLDMPAENLAGLRGGSYTLSLEYRVTQAVSSPGHDSFIMFWVYYPSGNVSFQLKTLYRNSTGVGTPVQDWQTLTLNVDIQDETPTRVYLFPYLYMGTGEVEVRAPAFRPRYNKQSQLSLTRDGVVLSTALLDLSDYAAQQDYTQLKMDQQELELSVVKDGEVRSAFAADTSSVTISSGRVTFAANTLVVNSDNFRLTETGSVSITGMFFSLGDQDQVAIHDGALFFSRKISDGSWKESAQLYSSGENAACGNFVLFGPGADGKQKSGVAAYTNYSGGAFAVYNAAGMPQFMVVINGDGNAELWFNGKKIM